MKHRENERPEQPQLPGMRTLLADCVAEGLMAHTHDCVARRLALAYIRRLGVTEVQFLINWAAGAYDGD